MDKVAAELARVPPRDAYYPGAFDRYENLTGARDGLRKVGVASSQQLPWTVVVSPTWGGHPSATLADIQSGRGWVHNTYLLEGVEKAVMRAPLKIFPKPLWFHDNRRASEAAVKMVDMGRRPSWLKVPSIAMTALGG